MTLNVKKTGYIFILSLLLGASNAMAQEDTESSNRQLCEQEAENAGLETKGEMQEYIALCLEEINAQSENNENGDEVRTIEPENS
jgi:hypothetical protein